MKATPFENLKCWQASRKLVSTVYAVSETQNLASEFFIKNQLKRASLKAMTSIAEGFDRMSSEEFISHLNSSKSAVVEIKCMLNLLLDMEYITEERINDFIHQVADDTRNCTVDLISYLQNK
jgi:four helix bundle protein